MSTIEEEIENVNFGEQQSMLEIQFVSLEIKVNCIGRYKVGIF